MANINVQFSDDTETTVVGFFGSPQDPNFYPNIGEIDSSDPRWKSYYDNQPAWVQQYLPAPI